MSSSQRLVRIKYSSGKSGVAKKLYGYQGWQTSIRGRKYEHKPIVGLLQNLPVQRVGRTAVIVPVEIAAKVEDAVKTEGGVVISVDPILVSDKEADRIATGQYRYCLDLVIRALHYSSQVETKELFSKSLDEGISISKKFNEYVDEVMRYSSVPSSYKVDDDGIITRLQGLRSIADQDLESAKIQAEFLALDLEGKKDQILK